jgi:hypothetical protein
MIHMMSGLPVSSIPQCKQNRHEGACLQFFQAIGPFEPTFSEAHQASKMICKVRLLQSRIKTGSFLEQITTSSNELFKDCSSDMAVEIRKLGNPTRETTDNNNTVQHMVGS